MIDVILYSVFRALFAAVGWAVFLLPGRARLALGSATGFFLRQMRLRGKVIGQNAERAFPRDPQKQRAHFVAAYRHLGNLIWEFFLVFGPMPLFIRWRTGLAGDQHWVAAKKRGKGVIFLSSHVGNWEIMGAMAGQVHSRELLFVTKKLKPAWFHRIVESARARYGVNGTYEPRTLKDVLSALKNNQTVGFVQDQYVGPPTGIRVPFFGIPVGTSRVVATLAKRTGAAVIPVCNFRLPDGTYRVEIDPPLEWQPHADADTELRMNTEIYTRKIEEHIRAHSDQWLWSHRRFKGDLSPLREEER